LERFSGCLVGSALSDTRCDRDKTTEHEQRAEHAPENTTVHIDPLTCGYQVNAAPEVDA
jgi:hypothetical protein